MTGRKRRDSGTPIIDGNDLLWTAANLKGRIQITSMCYYALDRLKSAGIRQAGGRPVWMARFVVSPNSARRPRTRWRSKELHV